MNNIKEIINNAMKVKGLTNKDLMEYLKVSEDTIIRMKREDEINKVQFGTVLNLCDILEISLYSLLPQYSRQSQEINEYIKMLEYSFNELPKFSLKEKQYIADMLNGSIYSSDINPISYLEMQTLDSDKFDGLGEKWDINVNELYNKITKLSTFQAYVIINKIRSWCDLPDNKRDLNNIW
jgi:DNA-binding Xre family transcriptional regulator